MDQPADAGAAVRHPPRLADLRSLVGGSVVDPSGEEIGRLFCIWEDGEGDAAYLGIKTGWLGIGYIHVVPAGLSEMDEQSNTLRLPFSKRMIREAPTCAVEDELEPRKQREVFDYYNSQGGKSSQPAEDNVARPPGTSGEEQSKAQGLSQTRSRHKDEPV